MKFCTHCGTEVPDEATNCPNCGSNVNYNSTQTVHTVQPAGERLTPISIVGFVLAFLEPLAGLIVSIIANKRALRAGNMRSASFARKGIIIGAIFTAVLAVLCIVLIILVGVGVPILIESLKQSGYTYNYYF